DLHRKAVVLIVVGRGRCVHARITSHQTNAFQAPQQVDNAPGRVCECEAVREEDGLRAAWSPRSRRAVFVSARFRCSALCLGTHTQNVEPRPTSLSTVIVPPNISSKRFTICSPSPVPPDWPVVAFSS